MALTILRTNRKPLGGDPLAERRMFAKSIIGSARFLKLPATSRLLYYDLGMDADDDGVVEAFGVIRKTGATEDDLRVLVTRGFVRILDEDLVSYITDWKSNNYIRPDRYRPSLYQELLLKIDSGIPSDNQVPTDGIPRLGEDRSGKASIGESRTAKPPRTLFVPPSISEVAEYCTQRGYNSISPQRFISYYTACGWRIGNTPMTNWQAGVDAWAVKDAGSNAPATQPRDSSLDDIF